MTTQPSFGDLSPRSRANARRTLSAPLSCAGTYPPGRRQSWNGCQRPAEIYQAVAAIVEVVASISTVTIAEPFDPPRRFNRRSQIHRRQIAIYVCHVVLQFPLSLIAKACGRERTTVGHACRVVEDRRDDGAFDAFVGNVERIVSAVYMTKDSRHVG
jgi:hypothetical protein